MSIHLVLKFHHEQATDQGPVATIEAHMAVIQKTGKVYWGSRSSVSQSKIEMINSQIEEGVKTYAFLYATKVPKQVHSDGNLWYVAELETIYPGTPSSREHIPPYYPNNSELQTAFLFKSIKPITFETGTTPKVPGQSAIRYCTFEGEPQPKNLKTYMSNNYLCKGISSHGTTEKVTQIHTTQDKEEVSDDLDLRDELIQTQNQIIELQQEVINLKEYRELYKKILDTDYLFSSEKFLETWVSENIHRVLPEIEILDRQPRATWPDGKFGILDLLGYNKESKDLVIIEIKTRKRRVKSGYDQFLRYTSWVRRNVDSLNQKYESKNLNITETPDFIIITDYVTEEMQAICKDHGIRLIKVFGGLGFEKVA